MAWMAAAGADCFCVLLIPAVIYGSIQEAKEWDSFAVAHSCKKVGHIKGDVQTGVGFGMTAGGNMGIVVTTSTPDKNGWICDDGITYWR
jgi:hypothetical protein